MSTVNITPEESRFVDIKADELEYRLYLTSPERDYIQRGLAKDGVPYELPMLDDMKGWLSKDSLVLDVGANIGNHTFFLSNVVQCKVIAFEANVALAHAMETTIRETGLSDRVTVHAIGIGEKAGYAEFEKAIPDNLGSQALCLGEGRIEIRSLDSFGIVDPIDVIKIDIEGMELQALKGARKLLQKHKPVLYIECQKKSDFAETSAFLKKLGYAYQDSFNATPTHLFLHKSNPKYNTRSEAVATKQLYVQYDLLEAYQRVRQSLFEVQSKYQRLQEEQIDIKADTAQQQERIENKPAPLPDSTELSQLRIELERADLQLKESQRFLELSAAELLKEKTEKESWLKQFNQEHSLRNLVQIERDKLAVEVARLAEQNPSQTSHLEDQHALKLELGESLAKNIEMSFVLETNQTEIQNLQNKNKELLAQLESRLVEIEKSAMQIIALEEGAKAMKLEIEELQTDKSKLYKQYRECIFQLDQRQVHYDMLSEEMESLKQQQAILLSALEEKNEKALKL